MVLGQPTPPKEDASTRLILLFLAGTVLVAALIVLALEYRSHEQGAIVPPIGTQ